MTRAKADVYRVTSPMIEGIAAFIGRHGLETQLFRAHIDIYVRTLRVDYGRVGAALRLTRKMVSAMTQGVNPSELDRKQKLYYYSLRILPVLSVLLP